MDTFAENIKNNLTNDTFLTQIETLKENNPNASYITNDVIVSIETSITQFHHIKDILLQTIKNGDFETLPTHLQHQIKQSVQSIFNSSSNLPEFITYQQNLDYLIFTSGLKHGLKDFNHYQDILSNISNFTPLYKKVKKLMDTINIEDMNNKLSTSKKNFEQAEKYSQEIIQLLDTIKTNEQEIENRKKNVIAFDDNIEDYKKDIDNKTTEAQKIIDDINNQREAVGALIADAEEALKLKSAEGISAALSAQYEKNTKKRTTWPWIIGSLFFVILAISGIIGLSLSGAIGLYFSGGADSMNAIISRISVVFIAISAAAFCAKQYTRQKRIAEDYAYKMVLAKSIVAFTEKLKEYDANDGKKSGDFLAGAIKEINRSPARKGDSESITKNLMGFFKNNKN